MKEVQMDDLGAERPGTPGYEGPYTNGYRCLLCGANVGPDQNWLALHTSWHQANGR